jgi:hypothetical protein
VTRERDHGARHQAAGDDAEQPAEERIEIPSTPKRAERALEPSRQPVDERVALRRRDDP